MQNKPTNKKLSYRNTEPTQNERPSGVLEKEKNDE